MPEPVREVPLPAQGADREEALLSLEWLVTNGLGGYASGTIAGVPTRRHHDPLVAALPAPRGRVAMVGQLIERVRVPGGAILHLGGLEREGAGELAVSRHLTAFRLERGLPVWRYEAYGVVLEKRVFMPHRQNTVYLTYHLLDGPDTVRLRIRLALRIRPHDDPVDAPLRAPFPVTFLHDRYEVASPGGLPPLRLALAAGAGRFAMHARRIARVRYRIEARRGYPAVGALWSPGFFDATITLHGSVALVASTEDWATIEALDPLSAYDAELERRWRLLGLVDPRVREGVGAELALAADQFVVRPIGRVADAARAHARGDEVRTIIAGYHWFTDWGRDTMIGLEGLTLLTGRVEEAGFILRTFANYLRDGLIPNVFPEGEEEAHYNTADATLWFFHALDRYLAATGDQRTLELLLPRLADSAQRHIEGTLFGIHADPADGLLVQGAEGVPLTWMDAHIGDWVVTPRRGKAVEINALWYNALRLLEHWTAQRDDEAAAEWRAHADRVRRSFNQRFWCEARGHLYDVVDGETGDDPACRPNQLFAISLPHPVLDRKRWGAVLEVVRDRLLTPKGLRTLAPGEPGYQERYFGDRRARDAAYHQGTVWPWLVGAYVDAWLRVHPENRAGARSLLEGLARHLGEACIGQVSEVCDAVAPYTPRGCVAQAWSVAELLRAWARTVAAD